MRESETLMGEREWERSDMAQYVALAFGTEERSATCHSSCFSAFHNYLLLPTSPLAFQYPLPLRHVSFLFFSFLLKSTCPPVYGLFIYLLQKWTSGWLFVLVKLPVFHFLFSNEIFYFCDRWEFLFYFSSWEIYAF